MIWDDGDVGRDPGDGIEILPEMSVIFKQLTMLRAPEGFINENDDDDGS
jgi:hypothetical protein